MNLSAPTLPIFVVSIVLAALALIGHFVHIQVVSVYQFWLAIAGYVVLCIGCLFKGL
jgi:hypothetical protein